MAAAACVVWIVPEWVIEWVSEWVSERASERASSRTVCYVDHRLNLARVINAIWMSGNKWCIHEYSAACLPDTTREIRRQCDDAWRRDIWFHDAIDTCCKWMAAAAAALKTITTGFMNWFLRHRAVLSIRMPPPWFLVSTHSLTNRQQQQQ